MHNAISLMFMVHANKIVEKNNEKGINEQRESDKETERQKKGERARVQRSSFLFMNKLEFR